jgi:hypothetical protein
LGGRGSYGRERYTAYNREKERSELWEDILLLDGGGAF